MINQFHGIITDKGLKLSDEAYYKKIISQFKKGDEVRLTIELAGDLGERIRRYYFGTVLNLVYKETGQPSHLIHEQMKEKLNNGESVFGPESTLADFEKEIFANNVREILSKETYIPEREKL